LALPDYHIVQKGDTLSEIAAKYYTYVKDQYSTFWKYMDYLVDLNNIKNKDLIIVGQKIKLKGSKETPKPNKTYIPSIRLFGLVGGTDRKLYVDWNFDHGNVDYYQVRWKYTVLVDGKRSRTAIGRLESVTTQYDTYDVPQEATIVTFEVRARSKSYKNNGKVAYYWGDSLGYSYRTVKNDAVYDFTKSPPATPTNLSISIEDFKLTASVSGIDEISTSMIEFHVYSTDSDVTKYSDKVKVTAGKASITFTVAGGHDYYFKCRGLHSLNTSNWSAPSDIVGTAPATPTISKCNAATENSVKLEWEASLNAESYVIQYATNETYFEGSDQVQSFETTGTTYTKTGLETGNNYYFRIQAKNKHGESGWSKVMSTLLGSGPAAPTTWSSTVTAMVGEKITLYWVHNTEDGSEQTGAKIELDIDGFGKETIEIKDDTNFYVLETSGYYEGIIIRWKVCTSAFSGDFGDYSAQRIIHVYTPPSQYISLKDHSGAYLSTLTVFPLNISTIVSAGIQKPIGYHVTIVAGQNGEPFETTNNMGETVIMKDGDVVYSKYVNGEKLDLSISAQDVTFENGYYYTVKCLVTMDSGLTTEGSKTFLVRWSDELNDFVPNASVSIDEDNLTASIQPYLTDLDDNLVTGVRMSVYRRNYDGTFTEIISDVDNNKRTWVTDPHPALDYARYRIVAKYESNSAVVFTDLPPSPVNGGGIVIQWDEQTIEYDGFYEDELSSPPWSGSMLKLPYNVDVSDSFKPDVEKVSYIGREHPVAYYGTQVGETSKWNAVIDKRDTITLNKLRRLAKWMGNVYVREPSGSGYWANITVSWNMKHTDLTIPISIDVTRVEGGK